MFLNNLHIDSYTKYEILFVTSLDHRIFFESSFSVFWETSVIIFGRKWWFKKKNFWIDHTSTLQNHDNGQRGFTCALLQHTFLLDNRILLFVIYNYWQFISHGQYNTIITDNLQSFISNTTWAIAFASFSCFSAIFRASEEIQDCLCNHFVGLWIL